MSEWVVVGRGGGSADKGAQGSELCHGTRSGQSVRRAGGSIMQADSKYERWHTRMSSTTPRQFYPNKQPTTRAASHWSGNALSHSPLCFALQPPATSPAAYPAAVATTLVATHPHRHHSARHSPAAVCAAPPHPYHVKVVLPHRLEFPNSWWARGAPPVFPGGPALTMARGPGAATMSSMPSWAPVTSTTTVGLPSASTAAARGPWAPGKEMSACNGHERGARREGGGEGRR